MSKFCGKCGAKLEDDAVFCGTCGSSVGEGGNTTVNTTIINNVYNGHTKVTNRNVAIAVILSLVTCGIYGLFWMASINDDANLVSDETNDTSGILAVILTIITCGIYGIYWNYKMGQKLYGAGSKNKVTISDNSLVYLIMALLGVFVPGLVLVNYCLMQSDLNKFS